MIIGDGLTLYTAEFMVNETGKPLGIDVFILYVNNEIQDPSTELGRLMHDFSCAEVDKYIPSFWWCGQENLRTLGKDGL